jgi:hypothetical protein
MLKSSISRQVRKNDIPVSSGYQTEAGTGSFQLAVVLDGGGRNGSW